jgi:hypothetical protein
MNALVKRVDEGCEEELANVGNSKNPLPHWNVELEKETYKENCTNSNSSLPLEFHITDDCGGKLRELFLMHVESICKFVKIDC